MSIREAASAGISLHCDRLGPANAQGPKDHVNIRILHSGSRAQDQGDSRNPGLSDADVYVVSWARNISQFQFQRLGMTSSGVCPRRHRGRALKISSNYLESHWPASTCNMGATFNELGATLGHSGPLFWAACLSR